MSGFSGRDLDRFEGMISVEEAELLHRLAAHLAVGCIVVVGSWGDKSIALARGAKANPAQPLVYYIDPHARFTGVYGSEFGVHDRRAFYTAMLAAGCAEDVALINLPSTAAAHAWPYRAGLVFVDGHPAEAAVEADVAAWAPHVVDGGYLAFGDALDPDAGPAQVIARLIASGHYTRAVSSGTIVVLQKVPDPVRQEAWATRTDALFEVRSRAEAEGYDGDFAISRIAYGTFVSPARRYMYMETPKAACTSWKRLIADLERAAVETHRAPYHRETRADMLIHQRKYVGIPTLLDTSADERRSILDGADDWHVFALCRNPYSRLVSVFENKVRLGEPGYRHLTARFGDAAGYSDARAAFAAFVREIAADSERRRDDAHLRPQHELLLIKLVPYRRVFPIEQMQAALDALSAHLQTQVPLSIDRANESAARPWRSYYDEATAAIAGDAYAEDFAVFGYDRSDWRGGESDFSQTEQERRLRAEIVARNERIERLYDLLEAQRESLKD